MFCSNYTVYVLHIGASTFDIKWEWGKEELRRFLLCLSPTLVLVVTEMEGQYLSIITLNVV